jgi:hypothetical protein
MYLEDYLAPYSYEEIEPYLDLLDPSIYITVETLNQNPFVMIGQDENDSNEVSDEDIEQENTKKLIKGILKFFIGRMIPLIVIYSLSTGAIHPGDGHIFGISNLVIVMVAWFILVPKILKSIK